MAYQAQPCLLEQLLLLLGIGYLDRAVLDAQHEIFYDRNQFSVSISPFLE